MKRQFELEVLVPPKVSAKAFIVGKTTCTTKAYVKIEYINEYKNTSHICLNDKDLERFAINILKAIKSKKLKR